MILRVLFATVALITLPALHAQPVTPLQVAAESPIAVTGVFQQRTDARFRLFPTSNIWTLLQLDTATGKLWQVQYTIKADAPRVRFVISDATLFSGSDPGRFTLYPTSNRWNFLLVDQEDGRVWQAQFSTKNHEDSWLRPIRETDPEWVEDNPFSRFGTTPGGG